MSASASASSCPVGALHQRRELEQLQVAHDAVGDVEVGVQAQLAEAPADPRDARRAAPRAAAGRRLLAGARSAGCSRRAARAAPGSARRRRERGHDGRQVARELARRRARGSARTNSAASSRRPSRLASLRGRVLGRQQRPRRARRAARSARPRNTSGRELVELAPSALRCSAAKRSIRSRASGGTCGDSIAAAERRRRGRACAGARPGSRARGATWRSSIGGRASARTTARGVLRVDEQAHPGEHVAHLGAPQEARRRRPASRERPGRRRGRDLEARHRSKDTSRAGAPRTARPRSRGAELAGLRCDGLDRLARGPARGRADRRVAPVRGRQRLAVEPLAHDFARARQRLQRARVPPSCRRSRRSTARPGSRRTCARCARCSAR